MTPRILRGDVLAFARHYHGEPFHALLTDPPYHLTSITERFGKNSSRPANGDVYARASRGFMGQRWDGGEIAFRPETWAALASLLHPGAFLIAFSGSRGWHRQAVAMEEAGLIMHPTIFLWSFGSGFPKATRIDTQVDRAAGVEPNVTGQKDKLDSYGVANNIYGDGPNHNGKIDIISPTTPLAQVWTGHRYGLQAMKPAVEPILIFQKPYASRPVDSITRTGAGALNIDGTRIESETMTGWGGHPSLSYSEGLDSTDENRRLVSGRWPSHLVLSHLLACGYECAPGCSVVTLDAQSGGNVGGTPKGNGSHSGGIWQPSTGKPAGPEYGDRGGASRFFFNADYAYERLEAADPVRYQAKASRRERDAGLGKFPLSARPTMGDGIGGQPDQQVEKNRNIHPTVKPIALCKWLSTLLLPPEAYASRRLLVPFAGSGSEMIGALLAGWDEIIGVEGEQEYTAIAHARLKWWADLLRWGHTEIDIMLRQWDTEDEAESESPNEIQLRLF